MSTRGRRSVGDSSNGLNVAMVHLLDTTRLRKELEARGLDTKGNKIVLADRLEEAIYIQKYGNTSAENSQIKIEKKKINDKLQHEVNLNYASIPEKTVRREKKRKPSLENNFANVASPKKLSKKENNLRSPESLNFFWASEAPIEALQKIQLKNSNKTNELITTNSSTKCSEEILSKTDNNTVSPLRRSLRMSLRKVAVQDAIDELSAEKEEVNLNKSNINLISKNLSDPYISFTALNKTDDDLIQDEIENTKQNCEKLNSELHTLNKTKNTKNIQKNVVEDSKSDENNFESNLEEAYKSNNKKCSKKKFKNNINVDKILFKSNVNKFLNKKQKKKTITTQCDKKTKKELTKITNTQLKTQTLKPLKVIISTQQKVDKNFLNYENNLQSPLQSPCGSTATSLNNTTTQLSSPSLSPSGSANALKKCDLIKKHSLSNSVDLLDMIFVKQDRLLADKYKSDQEKAIEKNLFELQKRKFNGNSMLLYEKKDNKNVGNICKSRSVSIDKSPISNRSKDFVDNNFDPRDPLNLRNGAANLSKNYVDPLSKSLFISPFANFESCTLTRCAVNETSLVTEYSSTLNKFVQEENVNNSITFDDTDLIVPPPPPPPKLLTLKFENENNQQSIKNNFNIKTEAVKKNCNEEIVIPPPPPKIAPKISTKNTKSLSPVNNSVDTIIPPSPPPLKSCSKPLDYKENLYQKNTDTSLIINENDVIIPPPPPPPKLRKTIQTSEQNTLNLASTNTKSLTDSDNFINLSLKVEKAKENIITKDIFLTKNFSFEEASINLMYKNLYHLVLDVVACETVSKTLDKSYKNNLIKLQLVLTENEKNNCYIDNQISENLCNDKEIDEEILNNDFVKNDSVVNIVSDIIQIEEEKITNKENEDTEETYEKISEKTENFISTEKEENERIDDTLSVLLKNPKALLQKASDVLKRINESGAEQDESLIQYNQIDFDTSSYVIENENKPLPDFHGEPVPDDDDEDDVLFEIAAGLRPSKKRDLMPLIKDEPLPDDEFIELDYYNADMNIKASTTNKWLIDPDNQDGFALMWGGVKSNYGILVKNGNMPKKIAFQIKIVEFLSLKHVPFEELEPHDVRIGWSALNTSNMLGESSQSYMFCSNARKATGNIFVDYGDPFYVNNVVTTVLDFNKREISYYKNQTFLGVAFYDVDFPVGTVVFPHIATKNCKVLVNFGLDNLPEGENLENWRLPEDEDLINYNSKELIANNNSLILIGRLDKQSGLLIPSKRPPLDKANCTVIAMVGLPGAGKTTWVKQYLREHSDEHWILFNTDSILNCMTVNGVPRRRVHQGRWDMIMGLTAKALTRSLQMACRRRHNYILDQTNVSREARKKKLTQFVDFQRKCVVIIPSEDELERRLLKQARQDGSAGQIPVEAMLELKGSFSIPCTESEPIEDVLFVEPPISRINEAIELVKKYNEEGRPWIRKTHPTQKPESVISDSRDTINIWIQNTRLPLF